MVPKGLRFAALLTLFLFCSSTSLAAKFLVPFDLPAGPLSEVLIEFAEQADVSLLVSKSAVASLKAERLKGVMTLPQALDRLLANSGLGYKFIDRDTVSISADLAKPIVAESSEKPEPTLLHEPTKTIDEIIVTAGRRVENLQEVPIAISVLNDLTLQINDIKNLEEIASRSPGLTVTSFSLGQPSIHMRGIGSNDDGAAMDNSVIVFLDDVYVGRITTIDLNVLDLERVEVLRGPQGTLYGKNAIGGAIRLISKSPTVDPELRLQLSAGNLDAKGINLLANGPLHTHWQGRLSIDARQRDGWQDNLILGGEKQHDRNSWAARSKLRFAPHENLEALWSFDLSRDNHNATGRIPVRGGVPLTILDENGDPIPQRDNDGNPLLDAEGQPLYETKLPTDIFAELGGSPTRAANGTQGFTDRDIWGLNQQLSGQTNSGSWVSISSYRDSTFGWLEDSIGLPASITDQTISSHVDETHRQFSQEFRWASAPELESLETATPADRFSYVMGVYFLYEHTNRTERFPFSDATARTSQNNRTNSYAVFGQLNYQLNDRTTLILGGRYNHDTKKLRQESESGGAPGIILEDFQLSSRESWQDFSPRFAFSYHLLEDQLLYGSIARGMKSGGFQGAPGTVALAQRTIDPEFAWAYELGYKSQWFQDRLRLNVAAFYTDYQDLQVVQFQTTDNFGIFQTDNAASANLRGFELEFDAFPLSGLTLSGSYAFLRATYDSFNDLEGRDFTGNRLRQAPKHSANLALEYDYPLETGTLRLHADYRYQSKSFREPDNNITVQPAYRLLDASLSFLAINNRWEASLWGKNLLDEEYIAHLYVLGGNDYALFGTPRTYGLTLTWHFL